jgi:cyanosortase A-associated protein
MSNSLSQWRSLRILLIALTLSGVVGGIVKTIGSPANDKLRLTSLDFPASISLSQWQLTNAKSLTAIKEGQSDSGQQYEYRQNRDRLEIQARYEQYTDGNVSRLLVVYTPIQPATVQLLIKHREGIGFYSLFEYEGKAYLSACLNSSGQSTVTEQQFVQNKYAYGWSPQRTLFWILGHNDLFDARCLWTLLSTSVTSDSTQNLENAWFDWYRWWKPKFSKSQSFFKGDRYLARIIQPRLKL